MHLGQVLTSVWQLLAGGPENDTLSAQGDLLIYGNLRSQVD